MSNTDSSKRRRFAIALSFPGERREYVEQVAKALLPAFGGEQGRAACARGPEHLVAGEAEQVAVEPLRAREVGHTLTQMVEHDAARHERDPRTPIMWESRVSSAGGGRRW